jgi:hypothetical protein
MGQASTLHGQAGRLSMFGRSTPHFWQVASAAGFSVAQSMLTQVQGAGASSGSSMTVVVVVGLVGWFARKIVSI